MNQLLQKAVDQASQRSEEEQIVLANIILNEIADEVSWQQKFQRDSNNLTAMAMRALQEHSKGNTRPLEFAQ